jgi:transcriptional regulator with XRE-family HTH domain
MESRMAIMLEMEAKYPRIGKELKKWRTTLELRQEDAARAIVIGQSFLSSIERGRKDPSIGVLLFIHRYTKISLYELLGLKEPEK